ncbi:hypothetical protein QUF64_00005, partial [Anaerolineales bacterium HSG6]|nr:hypothetical protein [Anaerolineales bacterium HSG6]
PTDTPIPTPTPIPTETTAPTDTPEPTATDTPETTDTPEPTATEILADTATPAPPTNTPEPTAPPEPTKPDVAFVINQAYLIPNPTYNSCPGAHQIYVTVLDAAGNPLDGVMVEDTGRAVPPHVSGEKGPGKLEYDMYSNGFSLEVTKDEAGAPTTSQVTEKMSTVDEDIPNEWLVQANYCLDINDCLDRKSRNGLCRGHYAYEVIFQKTH